MFTARLPVSYRKETLPDGVQPSTSRLGAGIPPSHSQTLVRKSLRNVLAIALIVLIYWPTLPTFAVVGISNGNLERGLGPMPRHRTGAIFEDKRGRWWARVRYTDELGIRHERKRLGSNKTDAKNKRDELLIELKQHGTATVTSDKVTFADLVAYYEKNYLIPAEYRDGRKIAGLRNPQNFKSTLKPIKAHFGKKRLRSLTYGDLRGYRLARLRAKKERSDAPLAIATVNREMSLLRRLLSIAQQQRWLLSDLFKQGETLITTSDETQRDRVLTRTEEVALLAECTGPRLHLRGLVICGLDTGMRRGEILLLRWEDVDLAGGLITIRAMHTKTLKARQVGITPRLKAEFERIEVDRVPGANERVFGLTNNFKRSFTTACKNAKILDLRFHDLRHTFASRLAERGMTAELIARLLGHSQTTRMTFRYVNVTEQTAQHAVDLLTEDES